MDELEIYLKEIKRQKEQELNPAVAVGKIHTDHKFYIYAGLAVSVLLVMLGVSLANQRVSYFSRASSNSSGSIVSTQNSYLFASPLSAQADGLSKIRISVFLTDAKGLAVESIPVSILTDEGANVEEIEAITDSFGRATFDVSSSHAGKYSVRAQQAGVTLPQSVSISFR